MNKITLHIAFVLMFFVSLAHAQVKIGENHTQKNPGSLLELESSDQGLLFTRVALDDSLSVWMLDGDEPETGMVVFNTNGNVNALGLYCWFNDQWNYLTSSNDVKEEYFTNVTRVLYDDGDSVNIASGRVQLLDSIEVLEDCITSGDIHDGTIIGEGDMFYVSGEGLYIRNDVDTISNVDEGFIFVSALATRGQILYAKYATASPDYSADDFAPATDDSLYYVEPNQPTLLDVDPPAGSSGYYAFAIPNTWSNPQISLKIKNSADDGFYKLDNCWNISRDLVRDGIQYQVWALDVPMRESVMHDDYQFMIE